MFFFLLLLLLMMMMMMMMIFLVTLHTATAENSMSSARAPAQSGEFHRGSSTNVPFAPGFMCCLLLKLLIICFVDDVGGFESDRAQRSAVTRAKAAIEATVLVII